MRLRHIGDEPRALAGGMALQRRAADAHVAAERREQAKQRLEQRGLAAAVGAEQREHLALVERHVELRSDDVVAIADGEIAAGEDHVQVSSHAKNQVQVRCMLASSQMKNGVPITAVRMPSGISTALAVRASVSMSRR